MKSSYHELNLGFEDLIKTLIFLVKPKKIAEFGLLEGYSLKIFEKYVSSDCQIYGYDIFDKFNGNHAELSEIRDLFKGNPNVHICEHDFFSSKIPLDDDTFDLIHIDIANTAETYQHALQHYLDKLRSGGLLIMEGGSVERDNVYWMNKYQKPKINPFLQEIPHDFVQIESFPSLTIFRKD